MTWRFLFTRRCQSRGNSTPFLPYSISHTHTGLCLWNMHTAVDNQQLMVLINAWQWTSMRTQWQWGRAALLPHRWLDIQVTSAQGSSDHPGQAGEECCCLLTLTEAPSLVSVVVIGGGAPEPAISPALGGTVQVLLPQEKEGEQAKLPSSGASNHHRHWWGDRGTWASAYARNKDKFITATMHQWSRATQAGWYPYKISYCVHEHSHCHEFEFCIMI